MIAAEARGRNDGFAAPGAVVPRGQPGFEGRLAARWSLGIVEIDIASRNVRCRRTRVDAGVTGGLLTASGRRHDDDDRGGQVPSRARSAHGLEPTVNTGWLAASRDWNVLWVSLEIDTVLTAKLTAVAPADRCA